MTQPPLSPGNVYYIDGSIDISFLLPLTVDVGLVAINMEPGQTYSLLFEQDATGERVITFAQSIKNLPMLNSVPGGQTFQNLIALDDGVIYASQSATYQ